MGKESKEAGYASCTLMRMLAMVAYTLMTVMFYLLGAAILHRQEMVPESTELISTLGDDVYRISRGLGSVTFRRRSLRCALFDTVRSTCRLDADVCRCVCTNWRVRLWG